MKQEKCTQCDEKRELKKDEYGNLICEECHDENENEGRYDTFLISRD